MDGDENVPKQFSLIILYERSHQIEIKEVVASRTESLQVIKRSSTCFKIENFQQRWG